MLAKIAAELAQEIKQEIAGLRDEVEDRPEPADQELSLGERGVRELVRGTPYFGDLLAWGVPKRSSA
jgi:hypothetical protein